jgi:trk system potassium uptake protein
MKTMILGAGGVGIRIAEILSKENHEITIIDQDTSVVSSIYDKVDCLIINDDASSEKVLKKAGLEKIDLLIAVTDSDQVNIMGCLLANEYKVPKKIARIQHPDYGRNNNNLNAEKLGIDLLIRPNEVTTNEIVNMIQYSHASEAVEFFDKKISFVSYNIKSDSTLVGKTLLDLYQMKKNVEFNVMSVTREEETFLPPAETLINEGDVVSFIFKKDDMSEVEKLLGLKKEQSKKDIFILGGGDLAVEVAKRLSRKKFNIKILEASQQRCSEMSATLDDILVLHGDNTDVETMKSEGIEKTHVFLAMTGDDQKNMLGALLAKKLGASRAITLIENADLMSLASSLGIGASISPLLTTASTVLNHIRGENVTSLSILEENNAEVIEFVLSEKSKILETPLRELTFPEGVKVGIVIRKGGAILIPKGDDKFQPHDHIIALCLEDSVVKAEKYFS